VDMDTIKAMVERIRASASWDMMWSESYFGVCSETRKQGCEWNFLNETYAHIII